MTNFLLFLILLGIVAANISLSEILSVLLKTDFTKEDVQVKQMTKEVREASDRLPHQKT